VLVADDDEHFRRGLRAVLGLESDIEIVAGAEDGAVAISQAIELMPDVVIMDMRMPRVDGVEATRSLRDALPSAAVVVLTVSDDDNDAYEAMRAGAAAYLLKDISMAAIADAVRAVAKGQSVLAPSMAAKLLDELAGLPDVAVAEDEHTVLTMLAAGAPTTEIARELWCPEQAVRTHVRNVLAKVHLRARRARSVAAELL
jgi:two-component system NarL family response regulator